MARDIFYYDGKCPLCLRSIAALRALDWLRMTELRDLTAVPREELPVPYEVALCGAPMRTKDGRVLVGYRSVRRALVRTPLGALVAWLLYVPGVSWVGERVYRWIASNRSEKIDCVWDEQVGHMVYVRPPHRRSEMTTTTTRNTP